MEKFEVTSPKFWIPILVPIISGLTVWAFNTNAEFSRRDVRLLNLEQRDNRIVDAILRLENKVDKIKDLLIERRMGRDRD